MPQKLCIHCLNSRRIGYVIECHAPENMEVSPVNGQKIAKLTPLYLRHESQLCGPDGKWFKDIDWTFAESLQHERTYNAMEHRKQLAEEREAILGSFLGSREE